MPLAPGTRLGPYEIVALTGAGGMGDVYKALDSRLDRTVAVKFSKVAFSNRFEREALTIASFNHPNICQIYDVGENYIVMEYIDGAPVSMPESTRKLLDIAVQIAGGLAAAHACGIIHRDLKPDNILVTKDGRVKILDFGLAKKVVVEPEDATVAITAPNVVSGTPAYMSPEQARGLILDRRSDQFSFGLILYQLVTGKQTFKRRSIAETMAATIREDPEPIPSTVHAPLQSVIQRCLAKDPGERYDSTHDLYLELKQTRDRLSESVAIPQDLTSSTHPASRAHLIWASVLLSVLLCIAFWPLGVPEPLAVTPFATEFALQTMPRWSPKGDRIAYVAPVNGILQVFTKALGHSTPTQITHESESCFIPFWSTDAARIYFIVGSQSHTNLRSIAVACGQSEIIISGAYRADLSPDGKTLAALVFDAPGSYRLVFSSPPGASPQPYSRPPLSEIRTAGVGAFLRYDRGGRYLGLSTVTPNVSFWRIPLGGEVASEIRSNYLVSFDWIDGGRRIVADSSISGVDDQLSIRDLQSSARWNVTAGASKEEYPALSPDGHTLALTSGEAGYKIIEIPLDGSVSHDVTVTERSEAAPAWSADGVHFAFATNRSGKAEVWLRNRLDGTERILVGPNELPGTIAFYDCAISPDGTRIAYRQQRESGGIIWVSPLTGEAPVRLWDDPSASAQRGPSWSPDGNWIAYYGVRSGRVALMRARVGGNSPPDLLAYMGAQQPVRWSPLGDLIAFSDGSLLRVIHPESKQNRVVSQRIWETYGWSKNGSLCGIFTDQHRREILASVDVISARETIIGDIGTVSPSFDLAATMNQLAYRGFSLNPNGKSFLTSVMRVRAQIYPISNFDRPNRLVDRLFRRPLARE